MGCPHVCELKLEVQSFHQARLQAMPCLQEFERELRNVLHRTTPSSNTNALVYSARVALAEAPESHGLRIFRQRLAQAFSSTASAWRRMGHGRLVSFQQFRELCQSVKCREMAPVYWSQLDPGAGGCISLFDLDPEASTLLARARQQLLSMNGHSILGDQAVFERLAQHSSNLWLEGPKAEKGLRALGVSTQEAQRVLQHLDLLGDLLAPPGSISAGDFSWLLRLDSMLHLDAVLLRAKDEVAQTLQTAKSPLSQGERPQQEASESEGSTIDMSPAHKEDHRLESDEDGCGEMSCGSDESMKQDRAGPGMDKNDVDSHKLAAVQDRRFSEDSAECF